MNRLSFWRARCADLLLRLVLLGTCLALLIGAPASGALNTPPGGPILVVTSSSSLHGDYYAEILRNEGLNAFAVADVSSLSAQTLAAFDVVILARTALTQAQADVLINWVEGGGNLITMAPDARLAGLLGITPLGTSLAEGYLRIDTTSAPGNGITGETMQFHGSADRYALSGALAVATLYSDAETATTHPAVTLRSAGAGNAVAFAYELASSVVWTRQGNPTWATQERDGFAPIRSDDQFYGNAASDAQRDWVDLNKIAIPQADEQQRLLAKLVLHVNQNRKPLPRFWYFPRGEKAVVIMSGDDHANGGTTGRFNQFISRSPQGCSVANWECVRGTSYVYPNTPLSDAEAAGFASAGFEVGLHINTGCLDFTASTLQSFYAQQVAEWQGKYASLPAPATQRHHCIVWSDWASGAQVQLDHGMRLDTSYYYWPPSWVANVPGLFTGSAMPMRFSALDGSLIDVYMAATQMTDESGQSFPFTVNTLLDRALGDEEYYGVYTVNAHTDIAASDIADAVVTSALARGVPIVSAQQMLTWLDGRNGSSFGALSWNGNSLSFTVTPGANATGLQAMVPTRFGAQVLGAVTRGGNPMTLSIRSVKGVEYAFFNAEPGTYVASYAGDATGPSVVETTPAAGAIGVDTAIVASARFSEAMDPATIGPDTVQLRTAADALVSAAVVYNATTRSVELRPSAPLAGGTSYTVSLRGGTVEPTVKDLSGNPAANFSWSFSTAAEAPPATCPCSGWEPSSVPANPSVNDPNPVELGVKFRTDVDGFVTGVRFYKGTDNTGTHVGNLWNSAGQRLASASFTGESGSGWQQVVFDAPVAVNANTVYIASYHAPNGGYAGDNFFFANAGVDRSPIHLLRDGESGGNGVYTYGSNSSFPASTYRSTNYWVDVLFTRSAGADTTPPTVTSTSPANGATGVANSTAVTATFNESIDPATLTATTFELRNPSGAVVPGSVAYDAGARTARLTPSSTLDGPGTYTALLRGGAVDPRLKDLGGNALAANFSWSFTTGTPGGPCANPANAIVAENCRPGSPSSEWNIVRDGDASIQGFATEISVNRGGTVTFKVDTDATAYRFDIYRMGYYGGQGARKLDSVQPSAALPQTQPACLENAGTGLIDCGNWSVSGSWSVPANAVSGIYFARLVRTDTQGASHVFFVVRDDSGSAEMLFQTADTTWQAYNNYGGNSLYTGSPVGRAYKVSYNRPFATRTVDNGQDWVFNAEYPMVRWLESNGYDVSYATGVDVDRFPSLLLSRRVYLSVGHDEYWSAAQRANVEAARNAGVHLAFFSGNEVFWKTRWENGVDAAGAPYRTLVCYKETHANAKIDPTPVWTGTWRDPRFSPPADGGRPENALTGTLFAVNDGATTAIRVPAADGAMRLWRNTSIASLAAGTTATLASDTLGYEWDIDADNAARPAGLFRLSTTTVTNAPVLLDQGSTFGSGTAVHSLTLYRHASGALVFGAGTVQWSWGLDAVHDRAGTPSDARMQQATVNLLADMGVQPATLQSGLVPAGASSDAAPASSAITSPAAGATLASGIATTISGTATDTGGGVVAGVEVSVDGGTSWRRATGRGSWTLSWTPGSNAPATIRSRAVDDSGNLESPGPGVTVNSGTTSDTTPPTVSSTSPADGATGISRNANITATFSEPMDPATISTGTVELRNAANNVIGAVVTYSASNRRATLNPNSNLAPLALYTVTVRGGATASVVRDRAGNAMAANRTWSFRTR